ncbi:hypothetical protein lerEdw1_008877 [Lerista edwardsae]|nr:hypothetical protein lerEdw1_008877 [Lerista edwardsae]
MAVVIRLQGLPVVAGSADIRRFFSGLNIPDGGVHIIGGESGEAFIIFATDEDARRAMSCSGGFIKDSSVKLFLSSKTEMQHIIGISRKRYDRDGRETITGSSRTGASGVGNLSNLVAAIKKGISKSKYGFVGALEDEFHSSGSQNSDTDLAKSNYDKSRQESDNLYLFVRGMPYSATEDDVHTFFSGLQVDSVIMLKSEDGQQNGDGMVKFATSSDAVKGRQRNREYMGSRFLEVEYYVHLTNLSAAVEKRDLRVFFGELDLTNAQITFSGSHENEKKDAFVMLKSEREYKMARKHHKNVLFGQSVYIFPISKKSMSQLLESSEGKKSPEGHHHTREKGSRDGYSGPKTCVYVRNFPFDVTKVEVQKFFAGFNIGDSDIHLLYDDKGIGLGEALVKFRSEEQAQKAESLNRRRFLGTEVLLRCIPEEQMQEFGINVSSNKVQDHFHVYDRGEHFCPVGPQGPAMQENMPPTYNHPPDNFICSPDRFRGPPPFTEFGGPGISGGFPDGCFLPNSNFTGGSDRITLIRLKNIPFRASPNEILDFFHGYKVIPESLSIQHNEYGMPSGEAVLALINYNEATTAVNELNDRPFGQRKVKLSLA